MQGVDIFGRDCTATMLLGEAVQRERRGRLHGAVGIVGRWGHDGRNRFELVNLLLLNDVVLLLPAELFFQDIDLVDESCDFALVGFVHFVLRAESAVL